MIFLDTNVVSEDLRAEPSVAVLDWLERFDVELALSTVVVAEIAFGIAKIRPEPRARRLSLGLDEWLHRFRGRVFPLTEEAAFAYGDIMGNASRQGRAMSVPDGMIAAVARVNHGKLATRNISHFERCGLDLIDPWKQ
ncbi:MAG: type II toxin-antitoxin system VapC family toxin [Mesorhizobium sp.]|nr:type II toxin-antitoxin system VapC family toxin [Mesorhizobium sp.]